MDLFGLIPYDRFGNAKTEDPQKDEPPHYFIHFQTRSKISYSGFRIKLTTANRATLQPRNRTHR